jgi:acyl dehydratase
MKGLFLEEIEIGSEEMLGSYQFTREAILAFAKRFDPQPFHLDEEAARRSHFGALCASGWHTAAAWMKCYVAFNDHHRRERKARGEAVPAIGPSPGFENLRWLKPVYPGDGEASIEIQARMGIARNPQQRHGPERRMRADLRG